jgi:ABC-2 type transport system ATP-binding protein
MQAHEAGIEVEQLTKVYRGAGVPALVDLTLQVQPGEIFGIIGPNGAGKTTLLGCLLGLLRPQRGRILIAGLPPDDLELRQSIGYLPERLEFDRWMTGFQLVAYHHALARQPAERRGQDVAELLSRVELESGKWDMSVRHYSRGMLQRLGLAQALAGKPRFLFLDEPASGVDPAGVLVFRQVLSELKADGVTVVLNSHQLDQIERVCDRVAYIEGGQVRTIEDLRSVAAGQRVLIVRWLAESSPRSRASLAALATQAGAELLAGEPTRAQFSVQGAEGAAALVRALVGAGLAVTEVAPATNRLERLFTAPSRGSA